MVCIEDQVTTVWEKYENWYKLCTYFPSFFQVNTYLKSKWWKIPCRWGSICWPRWHPEAENLSKKLPLRLTGRKIVKCLQTTFVFDNFYWSNLMEALWLGFPLLEATLADNWNPIHKGTFTILILSMYLPEK